MYSTTGDRDESGCERAGLRTSGRVAESDSGVANSDAAGEGLDVLVEIDADKHAKDAQNIDFEAEP